MIIVYSLNKVPLRLTNERWDHIRQRHPEMETQRARVLETVESPDCVQEGDFGGLLAIRHYGRTPLTSKFLVVAYREVTMDDGFILTAYLTSKPSDKRKQIWKR